MVKTKNVISYSLNKTKTWLNCWYLSKKNYTLIIQEDFLLQFYIRSIFYKCNKNINLLKLRIYRNNFYIFIDLFLTSIRMIDILFFSFCATKINRIIKYNKSIFLFIHKMNYKNSFIYASFIAVKIAIFIEKKVKLKGKVFKLFLSKITKLCLGLKIQCSGRLDDVDIAKTVTFSFGFIPLQSLKLNIDFSFVAANTKTGLHGVKVWVLK